MGGYFWSYGLLNVDITTKDVKKIMKLSAAKSCATNIMLYRSYLFVRITEEKQYEVAK